MGMMEGRWTDCRTDQDIMAEQSTLYYQRSPWCLAAGAESDLDIAEFKFSCVECHHHHQTGSREKVGVMTTMVTIWPLHGHYMATLTMRPMAISVTASPVTSITCSRSHSTGQRHGVGEIFIWKLGKEAKLLMLMQQVWLYMRYNPKDIIKIRLNYSDRV